MSNSAIDKKLSFVLPFTSTESFDDVSSWRAEVNIDCVIRLKIFLKSFIHMFDQDDLYEFFIVCPKDQCATLKKIISTLTSDKRYIILSESDVVPKIDAILSNNVDGLGGWYAQQIIKLAAHDIIKTQYYFVMDSDILCIKPCGYTSFVINDLCLLNVETIDDYTRIYNNNFFKKEMEIKKTRFENSLNITSPNKFCKKIDHFYGETPVIFSKNHVRLMINGLESMHSADWITVLTRFKHWTEYGLYFGFLDANNITDKIYTFVDCNTILNLEKSVWQENCKYSSSREYDYAHFFGVEKGYFVAVQSWIPQANWLPKRYNSKIEFYCDMEKWIFNEATC